MSGPIDDDDVAGLLALLDRGRQAWIDGELGHGPDLDAFQDDDMTIFGPWGGEAGRGPGLPDRQKAAAQLFRGGTGTIDVVKTIVSGDVVVVILIERNTVSIHGADDQPWSCARRRCSSDEMTGGSDSTATPTRSSIVAHPPRRSPSPPGGG